MDLIGNLPAVIFITHGKLHDLNILDDLIVEAIAIYVMDRGYLDFECFHTIKRILSVESDIIRLTLGQV
jgi:hypothetical protein